MRGTFLITAGLLVLCSWLRVPGAIAQTVQCRLLQWDPVTTLADETPLPEGVTVTYNVYIGPTLDQLTRWVTTNATEVACSDVPLTTGHYVAVTAMVEGGIESTPGIVRLVAPAPPARIRLLRR